MGPTENPTSHSENQETGRRKRLARRPRTRRCLLKGCERRFRPRQARQRYCSGCCRESARKWSRWKAQEKYRATSAAREKRNGQSGRYRERVRGRKTQEKEVVEEPARVITTETFFRWRLRPAGLLRGLRASTEKPAATVLLAPVPACDGTRLGTGTAMAGHPRRLSRCRARGHQRSQRPDRPDILLHRRHSLTFMLAHATGVSPTGSALGASAGPPTAPAAAPDCFAG